MSPRTGRPPIDSPKKIRLEIRLTEEESAIIRECADKLKLTKTDVLIKGVQMVKSELDKK